MTTAHITTAPQQLTGSIIEDYKAAAGDEWGTHDLFQVEGTNIFYSFYIRNYQCGLKVFKPVKFEGRIIEHIEVRIQPNGKRVDKGSVRIRAFQYA